MLNPLLDQVLQICDAETHLWGTRLRPRALFIRIGKDKKGYKKLPRKPENVKWSWEEMYPSDEPCLVEFGALGRPLRGEQTKLATVMRVATKYALDKRVRAEKGLRGKLLDGVRLMY